MLEDIREEYEINPETDFDKIANIFVEEFSDAVRQRVDEVIFADDGPVDSLAWIAMEDYSEHEFFYDDSDPDSETLFTLISLSPSKDDMPALRAYLNSEFGTVKSLDGAAVLSIPDTFQPGSSAQANVAFYRDPTSRELNVALNATPAKKEAKILNDASQIVPARNLEKFIYRVTDSFYDSIEKASEEHLVQGDILSMLDDDPDFRYQTTKSLPADVNPLYRGEQAELWQKSVSKESTIDGSQGFIRVWVPEDEEAMGFISVTNGDYDDQEAIDAVRTEVETALNGI